MGEEQEKKVVCLQPEYVGKFQCDGAACNSKCCRGWGVDIDGPTYQRYCTIEPKDERKKIVSRIKYKKQKMCSAWKWRKTVPARFFKMTAFARYRRHGARTGCRIPAPCIAQACPVNVLRKKTFAIKNGFVYTALV